MIATIKIYKRRLLTVSSTREWSKSFSVLNAARTVLSCIRVVCCESETDPVTTKISIIDDKLRKKPGVGRVTAPETAPTLSNWAILILATQRSGVRPLIGPISFVLFYIILSESAQSIGESFGRFRVRLISMVQLSTLSDGSVMQNSTQYMGIQNFFIWSSYNRRGRLSGFIQKSTSNEFYRAESTLGWITHAEVKFL